MKIIDKDLTIVKQAIKNELIEILPKNSISEFLFSSGKYIRSTLAILYFKAQNINTESIYKILAAGELLHNASLLHDDVIDEAEIRRGSTTIAKEYTSKISILAGDYLLSIAFDLLSKTSSENRENFKACAQNMIQAEVTQFLLRNKIPSEQEYLQICKGKTASLFITILKSCATELESNSIQAERFGLLWGLAFQIKNDLEKFSARIDSKNKIHTAIDVLGIEKTRQLLDNYKEEMLGIIKDFPNNIYKEALKDLITNLCTIERN